MVTSAIPPTRDYRQKSPSRTELGLHITVLPYFVMLSASPAG
jgi:hypothetical protein